MILSADKIADALIRGRDSAVTDPLVIVPTPDPDSLRSSNAAAIDLRLGTWFSALKRSRTPYLRLEKPAPGSQLTKSSFVPFGNDYILHPHSFVLAVTMEWVRFPLNLAAYVVGKSSWGRCGLIIATATGVHPGFKGCLTLELTNVGEIPIAIKPGVEICQLFIHSVDPATSDVMRASKFTGFRRPMLRPVELDHFAARLAAHSGRRTVANP
jgi:dCTP deaminase